MKQFLFISATVLFLSFLAHAQGTIIIDIEEGHPEEGGLINIFLFDAEKNWENDKSETLGKLSPSEFIHRKVTFELSAGEYSITAFHDTNNNENLDKNILGFPKERFAISNIRRTLGSTPKWSEVSFTLKDGESKRIKLLFKYL